MKAWQNLCKSQYRMTFKEILIIANNNINTGKISKENNNPKNSDIEKMFVNFFLKK